MKRTIALRLGAVVLALCLGGCAGLERTGGGDGFFEGRGEGFRGYVRVLLRMEGGSIGEIRILDHRDDPAIGGAAMEELLELALAYDTADLDAVSGATESSAGFLAAVVDARKKALAAGPGGGE